MPPDQKARWKPYPSIIDGLEMPFVVNCGVYGNEIYLVVTSGTVPGWYGITVDYWAYAAFDEGVYSIMDSGNHEGCYPPNNYIRETENSSLLGNFPSDIFGMARHFMFPGLDECIEVIAKSEPVIQAFASSEQAEAWGPPRGRC